MSRLMDIGPRHVLQYGLKEANVLAVAEESGVTRQMICQMIYHHFGDKSGFFEAITHKRETRVIKDGLFDIEHDEREPHVVPRQWVEAALPYLLSDDRITLGRAQWRGIHAFPELAQEEWNTNKRTHAAIARFPTHAAAKQNIRLKIAPEHAATNFASCCQASSFLSCWVRKRRRRAHDKGSWHIEITALFFARYGVRTGLTSARELPAAPDASRFRRAFRPHAQLWAASSG